jgi:hypothetical protein
LASNTLQTLWTAYPLGGPLLLGSLGGFLGVYRELRKHAERKSADKMSWWKYPFFVLALIIGLPVIGAFVVGIYLMSGDSFSAILAFQTGAIAPLVLQGWATAQANKLTSNTVATDADQ